jgi:hypothetical protein
MKTAFAPSKANYEEITSGPWTTQGATQYRMETDIDEKIIYVIFQGSQSAKQNTAGKHSWVYKLIKKWFGTDWADDFDFWSKSPSRQWFPDVKDLKVHEGFLNQYSAVRSAILDECYKYPDYMIMVEGYSLGAALAQIFTYDASFHFQKRKVWCLTYEPPNPWKKLPSAWQKIIKPRTVFLCARWDIVTWMRLLDFHRYGENITVGHWWRIWPFQHLHDAVCKNLLEKFGK